MCGIYECKKITLLLEMMALCTKLQTFALAGPLLKANCPIFSPLAQPYCPLFSPLPTHTREH
jgi:hypothetical protein